MTTALDYAALARTQKQTTWQIDPSHTAVSFSVKHLMIARVRGRFAGVRGTILVDESDRASSSVDVAIDAVTIDTRQEQRDAHLRSLDFLEVEKYGTIGFRSRRVEPQGDNRFRVVGDLTIRGVTREVALDATDDGRERGPGGEDRAAFSATTTIDRRDFGLTWNQALETGGVLVGNEITITVDLEAVKV